MARSMPGGSGTTSASSAMAGCALVFAAIVLIAMASSGVFSGDGGGGGGNETDTEKQARVLNEGVEACRKALPPGAGQGVQPEAPTPGAAGPVPGGQVRWQVTLARCVPLDSVTSLPHGQTSGGLPFVVGEGDAVYGIDPVSGRQVWRTDLRPKLAGSLDVESPWYLDDAPDAEWTVVERSLATESGAPTRTARLLLNRRTGEVGMVDQSEGGSSAEWYVFGPDTVLRVRDDGVVRLDPRTGAVLWRVPAPSGKATPPFVLGGTVFLHGDGMPESETIVHEDAPNEVPAWAGLTNLRRVDVATGAELPPLTLSEPVRARLYTSDGQDTLLMRAWVDPAGAVAVDARTGKVLWRQRGGIPEFDATVGKVALVYDGSTAEGGGSVQSMTVVDRRTGAQQSYAEFPGGDPIVVTGGVSVREVGKDKEPHRFQGWGADGKLAWETAPIVGAEIVARSPDTVFVTTCRPDPAVPELCTSLEVTAVALR